MLCSFRYSSLSKCSCQALPQGVQSNHMVEGEEDQVDAGEEEEVGLQTRVHRVHITLIVLQVNPRNYISLLILCSFWYSSLSARSWWAPASGHSRWPPGRVERGPGWRRRRGTGRPAKEIKLPRLKWLLPAAVSFEDSKHVKCFFLASVIRPTPSIDRRRL